MLDRDRLIKIMGLTTSDSDGEALAALRKANEIIAGEKLTWSDVLKVEAQQVTVTVTKHGFQQQGAGEDWVAPHLRDKVTIDLMFRAVFGQPRTSNEEFWQFMDSIHNRFQQHGSLTQGQYQALRRCYTRVVRGSASG